MSYQEQLNPWVVYQLLPDLTRVAVSRFRRRNDAEAYLKIMQQIRPTVSFAVSFDVESKSNHKAKATPAPAHT
jgi:hypothetical protein